MKVIDADNFSDSDSKEYTDLVINMRKLTSTLKHYHIISGLCYIEEDCPMWKFEVRKKS